MKKGGAIQSGGVAEYIADCPKEAQVRLREMRAAIREVAPDSIETVSYFDMPGYSYEGYEYNGMFVWFSYKAPFVRLHVRPAAILHHEKDLKKFTKSKAIINFPLDEMIPKTLVKKLVKLSLKDMKSSKK